MDSSEKNTSAPAGPTPPEVPVGEPGFAYLYVPDGPEERAVGVAGEKYEAAKKVYDDLLRARGDRRSQPPSFVMNRRERYVAWMNPVGPEIGLEEKAYDVCTGFGADAPNVIAVLMGHELTHYYEKHDWRRHFVSQYSELEVGKDLGALDDAKRNEAQADYLGGFLAYSAGYNVFDRLPELFDKLYQVYGLGDTLKGYPSLAERKAMALGSQARLRELIRVFDAANFLAAIGQYGEALAGYSFILKEYQSRELHNNAGVCAFLAALDYFQPEELRFFYPIELDLDGRRQNRGVADVDRRRREALLREAVDRFTSALALDGEYAAAQLNLGCAYALLGDYPRARYRAEVEAREWAQAQNNEKILADCAVLMGIIAALESHPEEAESAFAFAIRRGSALAEHNLAVLKGKKPPARQTAAAPLSVLLNETIDDIALVDFKEDAEADEQIELADQRALYLKKEAHSEVLIASRDDGAKLTFFHQTGPDYPGSTALGLKLGASREEILAAYKEPARLIGLTNGELLVYRQIFFELDAQRRLRRWVTYLQDE